MRGSLIIPLAFATGLLSSPATATPTDAVRIQTLGQRLETDRSYKIRLLAAKKLGALAQSDARRDPSALRALRLGLEDPEGMVRGMCARALAAHLDHDALAALEQLGRHDPDAAVRREARRAQSKIRSAPREPPSQPKLQIALGKVSVIGAASAGPTSDDLESHLADLVAQRVASHTDRRDPTATAQLRMDVQVERRPSHDNEIRYEVRVVLLELPKSHLRHTAKAVARADGKTGAVDALEQRVALEAMTRAVEDALATAAR